MAAEITIFEVKEEDVPLNKSQKQLFYEELELQAKISKHHFSTLLEMEAYLDTKQKPKGNILSIALKWMLRYCMPITTTNVESKYVVSLQNSFPIASILDGKNAMIASGMQFHVTGIKIPNVFIRHYNPNALVHQEHISDEALFETGQYGLFNMETDRYTQERPSFTHPGMVNLAAKNDVIEFVDDEQTTNVLKKLMNYVDFIEEYYNITFPAIQYDMPAPLALKPLEQWHIVNGVITDGTTQPKVIKSLAYKDFSHPLLKLLNKVQPSIFGKSFYFDMLYMLDKNDLLHTYNIGNLISIDDPTFVKEYNERQELLEYNKLYEKQVREAHAYYNKISRMKVIALNKYGIDDLDALDAKQKKVIDLEYKKFLSADDVTSEKIQSLFIKLQKSFNDIVPDRLAENIKAIEDELSKKELTGDALLPGGTCPHIYAQAKVILDNFGKSELTIAIKEKIVDVYSLPYNTAGYFCKICGEKLSSADLEVSVLFGDDRRLASTDDPLQLAIWKEAMYIVSSNIRFRDPIPIKPLVNSLASGLRPLIAIEEAKLYRSRTSSADSIRDTVNLYASIYIYASLCAIMMHNPGKLIFARDKPEDIKEKEAKMTQMEQQTERRKGAYSGAFEDSMESEFVEELGNDDGNDGNAADDEECYVKIEPEKGTKRTKKKNINRGRHRFVRGGKIVATNNEKKAEANIIKNALMLLIISKEVIIGRLKSVNIPIIKSMFSKAYKWATEHAKPIHIDKNVTKQLQSDPITTDSFYTYNQYARKLEFFSGEAKFAPGFYDIFNLLGRYKEHIITDLIEKGIDVYSTAKLAAQWHIPISKDTEYQAMFDEYTYLSYQKMYEYITQMLYTKNAVPQHVQRLEYAAKWEKLLILEKKIYHHAAQWKTRPIVVFNLLNNIMWKYNKFDPSKIDLARHFCPNGDLHSTGSYIYSDGKKETELTKKDILEWLEKKDTAALDKYLNMYIVNERCNKCKKTIRDAQSTEKSDKTLSKMFKQIDDISAFYQYYDSRCPKGNLHDIINGQCGKCGFITEHAKKSDLDYYNKYSQQFKKILAEQQEITSAGLLSLNKKITTVDIKQNDKYVYSLRKTAEWSQITKVKYNIMVNIGLSENLKFEDIEQGKVDPSKEEYSFKTRSMKLKTYIVTVLRFYSLVLKHDLITDLPLELKEILDLQKKKSSIDSKGLIENLPKFDTFIDEDIKASTTLTEANYTNFLQEYLANIIVSIHESDKYKSLSEGLVKYFTDYIIQQEKVFSKPIPFFFKLDITGEENATEDEAGISGDDWDIASLPTGSEPEIASEPEEMIEDAYDNNTIDVENADQIWDND
jgi:hypothetical protein